MKLVPITCLALIIPTLAFAAPPQIENLCFAKAARTTFWGKGEREAFIARCIADYTPTPPTKRSRFERPR